MPREQVLAAAMAAIAEHGLAGLTMAALGRQVGMSGGHLLYYFGSKDRLLLETLRWSEEQLGGQRREVLARPGTSARERLAAYADLYLPDGPGDPRWTLWIEVWGRSLADAGIRGAQPDVEEPWHRDLVALLREGAAAGEFGPVDAEAAAVRIRALLDGFSTPIAVGLPGVRREESLAHVAAVLDRLLAAG
ncbi:TetR/AcrR family transcriptional regulator [Streptacidiphilus sp. ASG 303]|nr:TetR/AcrR family transcriptional regulator [Streptacidiphilus sp. ASG 303]